MPFLRRKTTKVQDVIWLVDFDPLWSIWYERGNPQFSLSTNAPVMSILRYFTREGSNTQGIILPSREESRVFQWEYDTIVTDVHPMPQLKRKRKTYCKDEKIKIAKYANSHETVNAIKHFRQDFPDLTESTLRPWVAKYWLKATTWYSVRYSWRWRAEALYSFQI